MYALCSLMRRLNALSLRASAFEVIQSFIQHLNAFSNRIFLLRTKLGRKTVEITFYGVDNCNHYDVISTEKEQRIHFIINSIYIIHIV